MATQDSIVFFDGVCNFCNGWVNWLIARNKNGNLRFAPLQGKTAAMLTMKSFKEELNTVVYWRKGKLLTKSTAVLFICWDTAWYLTPAMFFLLVPPFIRNRVYDWFARNRYKWFGVRATCRVPSKAERELFLD